MKMDSFRDRLLDTNIVMASNDDCEFHDIVTSILVGFVAYKIKKRSIWMPQLIVHNGFRGQGIGTMLLDHVVARGTNKGKLYIDTIVHEEADLIWLKDHKFVASHLMPGYFGKRDAIQFRRML